MSDAERMNGRVVVDDAMLVIGMLDARINIERKYK